MPRFLTLVATVLTSVVLQTTLFAPLKLFSTSADLILVVTISFALLGGPATGAGIGFGGGLTKDLLLESPVGLTGLAYLIVGYAIGKIRPFVQSTSVMLPVLGTLFGSLAGSLLSLIFTGVMGGSLGPPSEAIRAVLLSSIYNTLLVPLVFPIVRRLAQVSEREKVFRW